MTVNAEIDRGAGLLEAVEEGNERTFTELYQRHSTVVFAFVLARSDDRGDAEEISADMWLGYWRSAPAFKGGSRVLTWLLGAIKHQIWAYTHQRRISAIPLDEGIERLVDDAANPTDLVAVTTGVDELLKTLRFSPQDLTEVVDLAWLHELPYGEITSVLEIPIDMVKSRVSRARRLLEETLTERWGGAMFEREQRESKTLKATLRQRGFEQNKPPDYERVHRRVAASRSSLERRRRAA